MSLSTQRSVRAQIPAPSVPAKNAQASASSSSSVPAKNAQASASSSSSVPAKNAQASASSYRRVPDVEHVLIRPNMYLGSVSHIKRKDWHLINGKAFLKDTTVPYAMIHIAKELASNMGDNFSKSRRAGVHPGECAVSIDGNKVTFVNGGLCMPIEVDQESGLYIPEMCFSHLRAGGNLGENGDVGGTNGIGSKAAGIFSTRYGIKICNPVSHMSYRQEWRNNLSVREEPEIDHNYQGKESVFEVWYVVDHRRLGYSMDDFVYNESAAQMIHWICASLSFTTGIPVTFNSERMKHTKESYAQLYTVSGQERTFFHETKGMKLICIDTPKAGRQVGFANYIHNPSGGAHLKEALGIVKNLIAPERKTPASPNTALGDQEIPLDTGIKKAVKKKKADDPLVKVTAAQIKPHVTVIISVSEVEKADWGGSQTKVHFSGPMPPILPKTLPRNFSDLKTWAVFNAVNAYVNGKVFKNMGDIDPDKKKGDYQKTKRGEDANWVLQGKRNCGCELHVLEGESAEAYDSKLLNFIPGGRNRIGTLTLRGKPLNVYKACDENIQKNKELCELTRRLGLKPNTDYSIAVNRKKLRYDKVVFMADSDIDGAHIKTLLLGFFNRLYPGLLECGSVVVDYLTPLSVGVKNGKVVKFYYDRQYQYWLEHNDPKGWNFNYYKGLGRSKKEDVKRDYEDKHEIAFEYDSAADSRIRLALDGEDVEMRKSWMSQWDPKNVSPYLEKSITITQFVDDRTRGYSWETLARNMPRFDSFTDVARKIAHTAEHTWGRRMTSKKLVKVTDFAGAVSSLTEYHHGDGIQHSVINMAQTHPGSNNVPFLLGEGTFGTLYKGGRHASQPRYSEVTGNPLMAWYFRPENDVCRKHSYEEGKMVEPMQMQGVLPFCLINGVSAVCTGWSSFIPCYHPREIMNAYVRRLRGIPFTEPEPWYRDYEGEVYMDGNVLVSRGKAVLSDNTVSGNFEVTCLPVGVWGNTYREGFLEREYFAGNMPAPAESLCTDSEIYFRVKGLKLEKDETGRPMELTEERIGVASRRTINGYTILDDDGRPVTFRFIRDLMEAFYQSTLSVYERRKREMMSADQETLGKLRERSGYIRAYLEKRFDFRDRAGEALSRTQVTVNIERLGLNVGFFVTRPGYSKVGAHELNREGLEETEQDITEMERKITEVERTTVKDMWLSDLKDLDREYNKVYGDDRRKLYL